MKVLIVKTSSLGDIIQTLDVLDYLKERYPLVDVDWVVEKRCASILQNNPLVDRLIIYDRHGDQSAFKKELKSTYYDHLFDLQGNCKSARITWMARSTYKVGFAFKDAPEWPNCLVTNRRYSIGGNTSRCQDYLQIVQQHFYDTDHFSSKHKSNTDSNQVIYLCPFSKWPSKEMNIQTTQRLMEMIHEYDQSTFKILWGNAQEQTIAHQMVDLPYVEPLDRVYEFEDLLKLFNQSRCVIAVDSLPLHIANRATCKILALFGPSSKVKYGPEGDGRLSIQGHCPYGVTFKTRCPRLRTCVDYPCMQGWTPEELFESYLQIMKSTCKK
ncbi:MAG: glycosyltransferase family 9 protein [Parachlamydiales bacterium]|nr:glycosyltransferase family 9 protein [Parachlamydiales bacterium]